MLKQIFRRLGRAPMFTAITLVTLALGIGANTAIFSVVDGVLIKPLPYPQSERLVGVWHSAPGVTGIGDKINCSPTMYFTYREENRSFQEFGLWSSGGASVTGIGDPEQVRALNVTYGTAPSPGRPARAGPLVLPGRRHARLRRNRDPDLRLLAAAFRRRRVRDWAHPHRRFAAAHGHRRDAG